MTDEKKCDEAKSLDIRSRIWDFTNKFEGLEKNREGVHGAKYFDINDVYNAAVPLMTECGIMAIDTIETVKNDDGSRYSVLKIELCCIDNHTDKIASEIEIPRGNDLRAFGSGITYLRRYGLCTMLNIRTPGEDDDALTQQIDQMKSEPGGVSSRNVEKIKELIEESGSDESAVINYIGSTFGVETFEELSTNQAKTIQTMLKNKVKNNGAA